MNEGTLLCILAVACILAAFIFAKCCQAPSEQMQTYMKTSNQFKQQAEQMRQVDATVTYHKQQESKTKDELVRFINENTNAVSVHAVWKKRHSKQK